MSCTQIHKKSTENDWPEESFIRKALETSNLNALRMALYQQTFDQSLAKMQVKELPVQGGAILAYVLDRRHNQEVIEKAYQYLISGKHKTPVKPTKDKVIAMMPFFTGQVPDKAMAEYGYEDLAFDNHPRDTNWSENPPGETLENFQVTIIGAGFSGIAAAIQLGRLGIPYRIIERMEGVGGTWHLNDYPEARVDISSFIYQFKFEQNYPWKSYFATRDELVEYVEYIIDKYDIRSKISLNTSLKSAVWNPADKKWDLEISGPDGEAESISSNIVISCSGLFSTPNLPDIPGIETFEGAMFHTTAWDHNYDFAGKRVALIGTGSTGSQLMPHIAESAEKMTVFQRTANWVMPVRGYKDKVSAEARWLFDTFPGYWNWYVYSHHIGSLEKQNMETLDAEWIDSGQGRVNERNALLEKALTDYIRSKVGDRDDLFEKLLPDHPPLARRLVIDNSWYDALTRENVELVTCGIEKITPDGIIDSDGVEHKFDMIILGAGFKVSKYLWPVNYEGRDGITVKDLWQKDGARAYLTMAMPNFPNFFMLYGPNSGVRGGSFHSWVEIFMRYTSELIVKMIEEGASEIEVKEQVFDDYNARMDEAMKNLLWQTEGSDGYFVNEHGRVGTQMPWTASEFYDLVRNSDPENYNFS